MSHPLVLDQDRRRDFRRGDLPVLGFSRQAFYAWDTRPVSTRELDDAYLTHFALAIHADDRGSATASPPTS